MRSRETLMCIVAAALLIYSLSVLLRLERRLDAMTEAAHAAESVLGALEAENRSLLERLGREVSDGEIEQLARDRLALVLPGEKVFYFLTDREERPWNWQSGRYCRER